MADTVVVSEMAFGNMIIRVFSSGELWLLKPDGEGMEVSADELEKLLSDYYDGNF